MQGMDGVGGLSILLKLVKIASHRFAQEPVSQGILAPNMLTVEIIILKISLFHTCFA